MIGPFLLIEHVSGYLKRAGIRHNKIIECKGDVTTLTGVAVESFGPNPTYQEKTRFTIYARSNGRFVDYTTHYGDSYIKKIND